MNIGKFCPLPLCTLIGNFRVDFYIVSLVVTLSNWVCDNWVYRFPKMGWVGGKKFMLKKSMCFFRSINISIFGPLEVGGGPKLAVKRNSGTF